MGPRGNPRRPAYSRGQLSSVLPAADSHRGRSGLPVIRRRARRPRRSSLDAPTLHRHPPPSRTRRYLWPHLGTGAIGCRTIASSSSTSSVSGPRPFGSVYALPCPVPLQCPGMKGPAGLLASQARCSAWMSICSLMTCRRDTTAVAATQRLRCVLHALRLNEGSPRSSSGKRSQTDTPPRRFVGAAPNLQGDR